MWVLALKLHEWGRKPLATQIVDENTSLDLASAWHGEFQKRKSVMWQQFDFLDFNKLLSWNQIQTVSEMITVKEWRNYSIGGPNDLIVSPGLTCRSWGVYTQLLTLLRTYFCLCNKGCHVATQVCACHGHQIPPTLCLGSELLLSVVLWELQDYESD